MFAIGEARSKVLHTHLELPKEYHLKRKKIYGSWEGDCILYLSDEKASLLAKTGKASIIFEPKIDAYDRLEVPLRLENKEAIIRGCITTIEIVFSE